MTVPCPLLKLCLPSAILLAAACAGSTARAQSDSNSSVHPITSLPKAPGDPTNRPAAPILLPTPNPAVVESPVAPAATVTPVAASPVADSAPATPAPVSSVPEPQYVPAPVPVPAPALRANTAAGGFDPLLKRKSIRPFSTVAISINAGIGGIGGQIAVPLTDTLNLRGGGDFFTYSGKFTENGLHFTGDINFRAGNINLDYFPFHNAFRVSPGVTLYNGNSVTANVLAPGGQLFDLGDATYESSAADPVHGSGSVTFGRQVAPQITAGFGNMIPRSGRHFSVPFEFGFQYFGPPQVVYNLQGTACSLAGCANIATDPTIQANIKVEQNQLNADIYNLRFYPIMRLGFAYKF